MIKIKFLLPLPCNFNTTAICCRVQSFGKSCSFLKGMAMLSVIRKFFVEHVVMDVVVRRVVDYDGGGRVVKTTTLGSDTA